MIPNIITIIIAGPHDHIQDDGIINHGPVEDGTQTNYAPVYVLLPVVVLFFVVVAVTTLFVKRQLYGSVKSVLDCKHHSKLFYGCCGCIIISGGVVIRCIKKNFRHILHHISSSIHTVTDYNSPSIEYVTCEDEDNF